MRSANNRHHHPSNRTIRMWVNSTTQKLHYNIACVQVDMCLWLENPRYLTISPYEHVQTPLPLQLLMMMLLLLLLMVLLLLLVPITHIHTHAHTTHTLRFAHTYTLTHAHNETNLIIVSTFLQPNENICPLRLLEFHENGFSQSHTVSKAPN